MAGKIKRRKSRQIKVGRVRIGGAAAISIQSMTKTDTCGRQATLEQINRLGAAGCEIVRLAVKNKEAVSAFKEIRERSPLPLVADIHFDYRLALGAIEAGADKIRINPGNMNSEEQVKEVVRAARTAKIPIRIGLNSGSISRRVCGSAGRRVGGSAGRRAGCSVGRRVGGSAGRRVGEPQTRRQLADDMVNAALQYIALFEKEKFYDTIISLKASDVVTTVAAYRRLAGLCGYPLHLGVTASGAHEEGIVKSSIGIGALLLDGIGDTIRVSLTADPEEEVAAAKRILQSLGLRRFYPEVISCPTCGRCQVDLEAVVKEFEKRLAITNHQSPITKIAIMGCEVNGPGEAREADIGIAAGKKSGILFKKGKMLRKVAEKDFVKALLGELKNSDRGG